jgi:hypothetical protein
MSGQSTTTSSAAGRRQSAGIYRVDVKLGPDPVWRTFFRVTE